MLERFQGKESIYRKLPGAFRVATTFFIVCLGWVFFRTDTLPQAMSYFGSLFGLADVAVGGRMMAEAMYTRYHILTFLIAVLIVWKAPETWTFTRTLSLPRAALVMTMLAVAVVMMWSQAENPFLYFRF